MRHTYQQAPVRAATRITWKTDTSHIRFPTPDFRTTFGIIELDSPVSARSWYTRLAAGWRQCHNTTAIIHTSTNYTIRYDIDRTSDAGDVVTAVLMFSGTGSRRPMPAQRALAQVSRYLIDVEIIDFAYFHSPAEPGGTDMAEAITQLISEKIHTGGHV